MHGFWFPRGGGGLKPMPPQLTRNDYIQKQAAYVASPLHTVTAIPCRSLGSIALWFMGSRINFVKLLLATAV